MTVVQGSVRRTTMKLAIAIAVLALVGCGKTGKTTDRHLVSGPNVRGNRMHDNAPRGDSK